ncbi:MAG: hypothetical protein EOO20_27145, partial [Chryseobacterium sp.]
EEEIKSGIKAIPLLSTHYLVDTFRYKRDIGTKYYELSDHLGNVLATVLDRKTGYGAANGEYAGFKADIASATDYYPFGMEMPGRSFSSASSRFGYNGQEKDNEVNGEGNSLSFRYRVYDSRIGKFLSIDPLSKKFPWWTPYQFAGNTPIMAKDLEGAEIFIPQMQAPIFMPRPVITLPRTGTMSIPRTGLGEVTLPPVNIDIPQGITVGQPHTNIPGEAIRRIEEASGIDWSNNPPSNPGELGEDWEDVTDPRSRGDRKIYENKNTGEKVGYDPGRSGQPGWEGKNHWHRYNPFSKNKGDLYLDKNGNPVSKGSGPSHIEAPTRTELPGVQVIYKMGWFQRNIQNPIRRWNRQREQKKLEKQQKEYDEYIKSISA